MLYSVPGYQNWYYARLLFFKTSPGSFEVPLSPSIAAPDGFGEHACGRQSQAGREDATGREGIGHQGDPRHPRPY